MKIVIQPPGPDEEEQIIIKCHQASAELLSLVSQLSALDTNLMAHQNGSIFRLSIQDVFYFETVDSRSFAYTENEVYQVTQKLYEIEERYRFHRFVRISKSVIVNLSKIHNITPAFNGRFEACLKNKERLIISRNYVPGFKKQIGIL